MELCTDVDCTSGPACPTSNGDQVTTRLAPAVLEKDVSRCNAHVRSGVQSLLKINTRSQRSSTASFR